MTFFNLYRQRISSHNLSSPSPQPSNCHLRHRNRRSREKAKARKAPGDDGSPRLPTPQANRVPVFLQVLGQYVTRAYALLLVILPALSTVVLEEQERLPIRKVLPTGLLHPTQCRSQVPRGSGRTNDQQVALQVFR
jgi:hypothetical protein